jgi:hypothetical protein
MMIQALNWGVWVLNTVVYGFTSTKRLLSDIYRLYKNEQQWFISDSGQFVDSTVIDVPDNKLFWYFDGVTLVDMQKNGTDARLPYLSGEMHLASDVVVPMDDFFGEIRYAGTDAPPFPVIMAAFMIHSKTFYAWPTALFKVFLRDGTEKEFMGGDE